MKKGLVILFLGIVSVCCVAEVFADDSTPEDFFGVSLTYKPAVYLYFGHPSGFVPDKYIVGMSSDDFTSDEWDSVTKLETTTILDWNSFMMIDELELDKEYYFAVVACENNVCGQMTQTIKLRTTGQLQQYADSLGTIADDRWFDFDPDLNPAATSQVFIGYPPDRDWILTWGGHLFGGGYPRINELSVYEIGSDRWRLEDPYMDNSTKIPYEGCCSRGTYDVANDVLVMMNRFLEDRFTYVRKHYFATEPWVYDIDEKKWFELNTFNFNPPGTSGGFVAYNPDIESIFSVDQKNSNYYRYALFDVYSNYCEKIKVNTWTDLGGSRSDAGMVYDSKRDIFWVVGGMRLGADWIEFMHNDTWIYNLSDRVWTKVETQNEEMMPDKAWTTSAVYDSLHDKIILFASLNFAGHGNPESRVLQTYILDPENLEWTRGADKPFYAKSSRGMDLNAVFSVKHNAALLLEVCRPKDCTDILAYRYSNDIPQDQEIQFNLDIETYSNYAYLKWDCVSGETEYQIFRAEANHPWDANYNLLTTVYNTNYEDTSIEQGKIYFYYVAPENHQGKSNLVRTQPKIIRDGYAAVIDENNVFLKWVPSEENDVIGYNLYRAEVINYSTYPVNISLSSAPGTPIVDGKPFYTWGWGRCEPENYTRTVVQSILEPGESEYIKINPDIITDNDYTDDVNLANPEEGYPYKIFAYRVKAVNRLGVESGWSGRWFTLPDQPTSLKASKKGDKYHLTWVEPNPYVSGYSIYGTDSWAEAFRVTDFTKGNYYLYNNPNLGNYQKFFVSAIDSLGQEGIPSNHAWADRMYGEEYAEYYNTTSITFICFSGADTDDSGSVIIDELIAFIEDWKTGSITIGLVLDAIGEWKNGC